LGQGIAFFREIVFGAICCALHDVPQQALLDAWGTAYTFSVYTGPWRTVKELEVGPFRVADLDVVSIT
jgi:hypothetical protein